MRSLVKIRALEPGLRLGWSVPRARRDYTKSVLWLLPALSALAFMRRRLPGLAAGHLGAGRVDAVMAHHRLATPALVRAVHDAGGELYVWTVDDAEHIRRLEAMGVDAVITNDPRLFVQRYSIRQVAALKSGGSAPTVERCPPSVTRRARRRIRPLRVQR